MILGFNVGILLCFIFKNGLSLRILIMDIPNEDVNTLSDNVYFYNDYDQIIPIPEDTKPKPQYNKLYYKEKAKRFCKRFGSMYGIETSQHKCEVLLRIKERIKRQNGNKQDVFTREESQRNEIPSFSFIGDKFSHDYIDNFWRSGSDLVNPLKRLRNSNFKSDREPKSTSEKEFSQDYVDNFWRSKRFITDTPICTITDFINNKCGLSLNELNRLKSSQIPYSKSYGDKEKITMQGKNKKIEVIDHTTGDNFSQDYVDDFWRSPRNPTTCTFSDRINNKWKVKKHLSKEIKTSRFHYLTSDRYKVRKARKGKEAELIDDNSNGTILPLLSMDYVDNLWWKHETDAPNRLKSNLFSDSRSVEEEVVLNKAFDSLNEYPTIGSRRNNLIQFRPNQFKNVFRSSRYSDTDETEKSSASEEKPKKKSKPKRFQIVKNNKIKTKSKKLKKESSEFEADDTDENTKSSNEKVETIKSSEESVIPVKDQTDNENDLTDLNIDTSDSFETGPKKASDKYQYLQGHRVVNPKTVKSGRRGSRLQTFLPKRYNWKLSDLHHLGYYWYEGPKGAFPSDFL